MLRQRVHHYCFLQTVLKVVAYQLQGLVVSVDHCCCTAIGQGDLLLHVYFHCVELLDRLVDDTDRVLADHHVVFSYPLGHVIHLILKLVELMHQSLCLLLKAYGLKIQRFLHTLQRLDFMCFMLYSFVNAGDTHYCLIIVAVEVEEILMMTAGGLVPQIQQQILNIFFCLLDIVQREDVVLIEIQLVVDLLKDLQYVERLFSSILDGVVFFAGGFFFLTAFILAAFLLLWLGG